MRTNFYLYTLGVMGVRLLGAVSSFALTLAVTRSMSSADAGLLLSCLLIINVIGTLACFGGKPAVIKIVGARESVGWLSVNKDLSVILSVVFCISLILILLSIVFPSLIASGVFGVAALEPLLVSTGIGIAAFAGLQIFTSALFGLQYSNVASLYQNCLVPFFFVALLFLFRENVTLNPGFLLFLYLAALFVTLFLSVITWWKASEFKFIKTVTFPFALRKTLQALFIVSLMNLTTNWAAQFASIRYLDSSSLAYLSSAQRVAMLITLVLIAVNLVVSPRFANAFAKGENKEVNTLALKSSQAMLVFSLPALIFLFLFAEQIMTLFGDEYRSAALPLKILAFGQFINVVTGSVGVLLTMTGHEKDLRNISIISGTMSIVLSFWWTSNYGILGAAAATAVCLALQNLFAVVAVKKRLGFNTINLWRKIV